LQGDSQIQIQKKAPIPHTGMGVADLNPSPAHCELITSVG
jgi:hypothetical protein